MYSTTLTSHFWVTCQPTITIRSTLGTCLGPNMAHYLHQSFKRVPAGAWVPISSSITHAWKSLKSLKPYTMAIWSLWVIRQKVTRFFKVVPIEYYTSGNQKLIKTYQIICASHILLFVQNSAQKCKGCIKKCPDATKCITVDQQNFACDLISRISRSL